MRPLFRPLFAIAFCFILFQTTQVSGQNQLTINEKGYLDSRNVSVLAFHNIYPVGMQGGIEIIQHNLRTSSNGTVSYRLHENVEEIPGVNVSHEPIPKINNPERQIEGNIITLPFSYDAINLAYEIVIEPTADFGFEVRMNFKEPVDTRIIEEVEFSMEFYPELYAGKSYVSESGFGVFPFVFNGTVKNGAIPYATGHQFILAPEDERISLKISSESNEIRLSDSRAGTQRYWYTIKCKADLTKTEKAVSLKFQPNVIEGWKKPAMIAYSQAGYHPNQEKKIILELDKDTGEPGNVILSMLTNNGTYEKVLEKKADLWGKFLRYQYATASFTSVKKPGIYKISYEDQETGPFKIASDVYGKGPWEMTLDVFYPVQMCHMKVTDRGRVWHGVCHLDDALQVPSPLPFFDGYRQADYSDTDYEPHTTIDDLSYGGWHDAADDDIHYVSTGKAAYDLALAVEEFGIDRDQTTVDFEKREVYTYQPDGIPDALQQVIHGAKWLVAHYRVSDHAFPGVISSNWDTYVSAADWGLFTDNLFYNPAFPEDSADGTFSGKLDDRYVFTNRDTRRDFFASGILAAISRIIEVQDPDLAEECLLTSQTIWAREQAREPVFYRNVGTPQNLVEEKTRAAVELYLTTGDKKYLKFLEENREKILDEIDRTGWLVSRVLKDIDNQDFKEDFTESLSGYRDRLIETNNKNPFGLEYGSQVWGIGWNILWQAEKEYYLVKHHPDLFDPNSILDALAFVLGRHPGNNISFVSGIGTHRPIPSFAVNKMDYGFTPGGVFSGTSLVLPDFPELREDHPFLWQQSEIMIWGATPYLFTVLAADKLLNQ